MYCRFSIDIVSFGNMILEYAVCKNRSNWFLPICEGLLCGYCIPLVGLSPFGLLSLVLGALYSFARVIYTVCPNKCNVLEHLQRLEVFMCTCFSPVYSIGRLDSVL